MKFMKKYSAFIGLVVMIGIILLPRPEGLTAQGKRAIAVFVFALFVWLFRPYAEAASSLLILTLLILLKVQDNSLVFGALGSDTNFLVLSGLIISIAMDKTGVAKRISLYILASSGKSSAHVLLKLMFVSLALAFLMPSGTARTTMLFPIVLAIIPAFGLRECGKSNMAKQIVLTIPAADHFATSAIMTATGSNILAVELMKRMTGVKVYYSDWLLWGIVPNLVMIFIWWILIRIIFPFKGSQVDKIKLVEEQKKLGALSIGEKKVLAIFVLIVGTG
jgi:anion transporter